MRVESLGRVGAFSPLWTSENFGHDCRGWRWIPCEILGQSLKGDKSCCRNDRIAVSIIVVLFVIELHFSSHYTMSDDENYLDHVGE